MKFALRVISFIYLYVLQIVRRYTLKDTDIKPESFIADLAVDITPGQCDEAYAYMSDFSKYGIVVYSWKENDSWRIEHHFFHFDPLNGTVSEGKLNVTTRHSLDFEQINRKAKMTISKNNR